MKGLKASLCKELKDILVSFICSFDVSWRAGCGLDQCSIV